MPKAVNESPIRPNRLKTVFEESGDRQHIVYRRRDWGTVIFMTLWLTGWTVGCVFLVALVLSDGSAFTFLFAIPFWASWLFVFVLVLNALFRFEEMSIDNEGVKYVRRVFVPLMTRAIPLAEIKACDRYTIVVDSENNRTESGIEIQTLGRSLRCLQGLPDDELAWLRDRLARQLANLRGDRVETIDANEASRAEPSQVDAAQRESDVIPLTGSPKELEPPSDTRWLLSEGFPVLTFSQRGQFQVLSIFGLLFVNTFWNGGVAIFVCVLLGAAPVQNPPQGGMWWGMFFFLVPFEVIGLVMLTALIGALTAPAISTRWAFTDDRIEYACTWFGMGRRRNWIADGLARVEVRQDDSLRSNRFAMRRKDIASDSGDLAYRVFFVDCDNVELCSIKGLSEGEARWIARTVLRERQAWFRPGGRV